MSNLLSVRVKSEGGVLVAECSPIDVVVQGRTWLDLFTRLGAQISVELEHAGSFQKIPHLFEDLKFDE